MQRPSQRVSDAERDEVVAALREHLLAGRLTLEEFSERVDAALKARVAAELAQVQADLPRLPVRPLAGTGRPTRLTVAIFGHVVRRGQLRLRRATTVVSAFADVDLDLRLARIDGERTIVRLFVLFGNVDVYVPEGIHLEPGGITVFGHRRDWGHEVVPPHAPTVRVQAAGCFSTIDVWRVPSGTKGSYGDVVRKVKKLHKNKRIGFRRLPELEDHTQE